MQRWIVIAVVGALLFGLGGGFALWTYYQNRPKVVWVPLALNEELPVEKREELAVEIKAKILEGSTIPDAVRDTGLTSKLNFSSAAEAEAEVRKRLFVKVGEAETPAGRVPSINVGLDCQRKSFDAMGQVAMRIMKDVWKMLGIKEPEEKSGSMF